jgi:hypothetical protein
VADRIGHLVGFLLGGAVGCANPQRSRDACTGALLDDMGKLVRE